MKKIITTIKNQIGFITLNNPDKANALNADMRDTLIQSYRNFEKNADIKIIILNSNGKHFCAGADLNHMREMQKAPYEKNLQDAKQFAELFYTIYSCQKPTIACAQGKTIGGGLGLLAASDITIATSDAAFCFSEVKVGLIPATIAPFVLQRIGYHYANYFMMTAELFDAQKSLEIRLIDHLNVDAESIAKSLLENNQSAIVKTKQWLQQLSPITQETMNKAATQLADARAKSFESN